VVLLRGDVTVNDRAIKGEALIATLAAAGQGIEISAEAESKQLVLSGARIEEPVASYGPFVMNTQQEIRQAVADFRAGKMGRLN
jgi:redox-sensitive bicupin YhaK (pirin superfamily)